MTPQDLVDIELIKQLKHRYMRCVDQKRWAELRECFADDATSAYSGGKYAHTGGDAICQWLAESMSADTFHSCHRVTQPEIRITGAGTAEGTWGLEDTVIETQHEFTLHGAGFYADRYVKIGDAWKIQHIGYERTFEQVESRKGIPGLKLTASAWATGGRSEIDA